MGKPKTVIRVLLAESDNEFRKNVAATLTQCGRIELIAAVRDGTEALRIAREKRPDLVILDAMLPHMDGLTVASVMQKEHLAIDVMIMSVFIGPQFYRECRFLKVADILPKPLLPSTVLSRVELWYDSKEQHMEQLIELTWQQRLTKLLRKLNIPQGTKGYLYINGAILYELMHEGASSKITKEIYPELARKYKNSKANVEHAIRNAIEQLFKKGDRAWLEEHFGPSSGWEKGRPTNAAFIYGAALLLRQRDIEEIL